MTVTDAEPEPTEPLPSKTAAYDLGDDPKAMLGVPEYHAYLFDRSGKDRLKELSFTSLSWARTIDNYSEAQITIGGDVFGTSGEDLRDDIDCWMYEVGIYRNNAKVWCGPITNVEMEAGSLVISAADISVWLQHRLIYHDWKFNQIDLAWIATWIVQDAMSVDNVPGLKADFTLTGIKGDRDYRAKQYLSASDELDELSRTGLDWTVINRHMIAGNFEIPATPIAHLMQEHLAGDPGISIVGGSMGTRFIVIGSESTESVAEASKAADTKSSAKKTAAQEEAERKAEEAERKKEEAERKAYEEAGSPPKIVGIAAGGDPEKYGVHDRVVQESSILDIPSARANAKSRLDVLDYPPIVFSNATLVPTAPVNVDQLIPGRTVSVLLEYPRESKGDYRIKSVKGTWSATTVNDVSIDLEPVGSISVDGGL